VFAFVAEKKTGCPQAPGAEAPRLPDWLEDPKKPVALAADAEQLAQSYRFCAELLEALKGGTATLEQLGQQLGPKHGLTPEQAEHLIGGTLMQWVALGRQNLQRE